MGFGDEEDEVCTRRWRSQRENLPGKSSKSMLENSLGNIPEKIVGKFAAALAAGVLFAAIPGGGLTAWAGEWSQTEDGTWYYLEEGERVTGWQRIDGVWYCLDEESGPGYPSPPSLLRIFRICWQII